MTATAVLPRIISVDDHVVEPANLWTSRVSSKYKDAAPRVERKRMSAQSTLTGMGRQYQYDVEGPDAVWGDVWMFEGAKAPMWRAIAAAGFPPAEVDGRPITYDEMRPGCFQAAARLADMD